MSRWLWVEPGGHFTEATYAGRDYDSREQAIAGAIDYGLDTFDLYASQATPVACFLDTSNVVGALIEQAIKNATDEGLDDDGDWWETPEVSQAEVCKVAREFLEKHVKPIEIFRFEETYVVDGGRL